MPDRPLGVALRRWTGDVPAPEDRAAASIDRHGPELARPSDQVWGYAETALRETRSAQAIKKESAEKVAGEPYQSYLPAGPPTTPRR